MCVTQGQSIEGQKECVFSALSVSVCGHVDGVDGLNAAGALDSVAV